MSFFEDQPIASGLYIRPLPFLKKQKGKAFALSSPAKNKKPGKESAAEDAPDIRFRFEGNALPSVNLSVAYHPFTKPSFLKGTGLFAEFFAIFGYSYYKYSWDQHTYYIQRHKALAPDGPFFYYTERTTYYFKETVFAFGLGLNIALYERPPRANVDFLYSLSLRGSTGVFGINSSDYPSRYDFANLYFKGGGELGLVRGRMKDDLHVNFSVGLEYLAGVKPQTNSVIYTASSICFALTWVWGAKKEMSPWIPIHTQHKKTVTQEKVSPTNCPSCKRIVKIIPEVKEKVERVRIQFILDLINGLHFPTVHLPASSINSHQQKYRALILGVRNNAQPKDLNWLTDNFKFFIPKGTIIKLYELGKKINTPKLQWVYLNLMGRGKDSREATQKIHLIKAFLSYAGINLSRMETKVINGASNQHLVDFEINLAKSLQKAREILPRLIAPDLRPQARNYPDLGLNPLGMCRIPLKSRRLAFADLRLGKPAPDDQRQPIGAWNFRLGLEVSALGFTIRPSLITPNPNYIGRISFHYEHEDSRLNPFVSFGFRSFEQNEDHYHLYLGGGLKWTVFDLTSPKKWSFFSRLDLQVAALAVFRPYWGWETVGYWEKDANAYSGSTYKTRKEKRLFSATTFAADISLHLNLFSYRPTSRDRIDVGVALGRYISSWYYPYISFPITWRRDYKVPLYPFLRIKEEKIKKFILSPCEPCPPPIIEKQPIVIQRRDIQLALTIINNIKLPTVYFETAIPKDPEKNKTNALAQKYAEIVRVAEQTFEAIPYAKIKTLFTPFFREEEIRRLWDFARKINSNEFQWVYLNIIGKASVRGEGKKGVDNTALSDRRARLCYSFLLLCGINASRIELVSAGVKRPNVVVKEEKDHDFNQAGVFEIDFEKSNAAFKQHNPQHFIQIERGRI